jgi:hypothetical protein
MRVYELMQSREFHIDLRKGAVLLVTVIVYATAAKIN